MPMSYKMLNDMTSLQFRIGHMRSLLLFCVCMVETLRFLRKIGKVPKDIHDWKSENETASSGKFGVNNWGISKF